MSLNRSLLKLAAAGAVAASALFATAAANAQVNWAVGVNVPGVSVGVVEPGPVYYRPAPVYSPPPAPVYYEPAPRAYYPPAYYRPVPVYDVQPGPGYWRREAWRHHHRDWDDRGERGYRY